MNFLIFVGAVCFSAFMVLCIYNVSKVTPTAKKKAFGVILVVALLAVLGILFFGINPLVIIYGGGLGLAFTFIIKKEMKKATGVIAYSTFFLVGLNAVSLLALRLLGLGDWYVGGTRWGLVNLVVAALVLAVAFVSDYFFKRHVDINTFKGRTAHLLIVISGAALGFIYASSVIDGTYFQIGRLSIDLGELTILLFFVCIGVLTVVLFRYTSREAAVHTEAMITEASKKYVQDLEESYKALRTIKHDYVNILTSFKLYIDGKDMDGLERYYYNELSQLNKELLYQDQLLSNLHNLNASEVKSVLIYKCSVAADKGMNMNIEVREQINDFGISTAILCQILGILLDNAMEAAAETEKKIIGIAIIKNANSKTFLIKNTWNNQEISINKIFELGFSTKGKQRGDGLSIVRNYADKLNNVLIETVLGDEYFTQILTIKDDK